jgi:hypothetical protein
MKYFPASNDSREVRDRLVAACRQRGVELACKASVEGLTRLPGGGWRCTLADGTTHEADRVVRSPSRFSHAPYEGTWLHSGWPTAPCSSRPIQW